MLTSWISIKPCKIGKKVLVGTCSYQDLLFDFIRRKPSTEAAAEVGQDLWEMLAFSPHFGV